MDFMKSKELHIEQKMYLAYSGRHKLKKKKRQMDNVMINFIGTVLWYFN